MDRYRRLMSRLCPRSPTMPTQGADGVGRRSPLPATPAFGQYAEMRADAPSFRVKGRQSPGKDPNAMSEQDIAAALGMVGDRLASEIFAVCWAPDLASLSMKQVRDELYEVVIGDFKRRKMALELAELELDCAIAAAEEDKSRQAKSEVAARRRQAETARADRWPEQVARYRRVSDAVLSEIGINNLCQACHGRGVKFLFRTVNVKNGGAEMIRKPEDCRVCGGRGTLPVSDRKRAQLLGMDESTFRRNGWNVVYEWLHEHTRELESRACRAVRSALMGF